MVYQFLGLPGALALLGDRNLSRLYAEVGLLRTQISSLNKPKKVFDVNVSQETDISSEANPKVIYILNSASRFRLQSWFRSSRGVSHLKKLSSNDLPFGEKLLFDILVPSRHT